MASGSGRRHVAGAGGAEPGETEYMQTDDPLVVGSNPSSPARLPVRLLPVRLRSSSACAECVPKLPKLTTAVQVWPRAWPVCKTVGFISNKTVGFIGNGAPRIQERNRNASWLIGFHLHFFHLNSLKPESASASAPRRVRARTRWDRLGSPVSTHPHGGMRSGARAGLLRPQTGLSSRGLRFSQPD
jgi:hypothetical protein